MVMSSMYRAAPVTLSRPSLRGTDLPMMCSSVMPIHVTVLSSLQSCHPEQSEGSVVCRGLPVPRFARNNNISLEANLSPSSPSAELATAEHGLPAQVRSFHHTP